MIRTVPDQKLLFRQFVCPAFPSHPSLQAMHGMGPHHCTADRRSFQDKFRSRLSFVTHRHPENQRMCTNHFVGVGGVKPSTFFLVLRRSSAPSTQTWTRRFARCGGAELACGPKSPWVRDKKSHSRELILVTIYYFFRDSTDTLLFHYAYSKPKVSQPTPGASPKFAILGGIPEHWLS